MNQGEKNVLYICAALSGIWFAVAMFVLAQSIDDTTPFWGVLSSVGSFLAGAGTIILAFLAGLTYKNWKNNAIFNQLLIFYSELRVKEENLNAFARFHAECVGGDPINPVGTGLDTISDFIEDAQEFKKIGAAVMALGYGSRLWVGAEVFYVCLHSTKQSLLEKGALSDNDLEKYNNSLDVLSHEVRDFELYVEGY